MECPSCKADIDVEIDLEVFAHGAGAEISFICPECEGRFFCLLTAGSFVPVPPEVAA